METSCLAHRSGRIFGPDTLEDNWFEDRDQSVAGGVGGKLISKDTQGGFTVISHAGSLLLRNLWHSEGLTKHTFAVHHEEISDRTFWVCVEHWGTMESDVST